MTDNYKKMEEKYKEIVTATDEIKDEKQSKGLIQTDEQSQNKEITEVKEQNKELTEVKEQNKELTEFKELNQEITEFKEQNQKLVEGKEQNSIGDEEEKQPQESENNDLVNELPKSEDNIQETDNQDLEAQKNKVEDVKDKILSFESMYREIFGKEPYGGRLKPESPNKKLEQEKYKKTEEELDDNVSVFENMEEYKKPTYKFIGIAFKTYIILEMNNELYIMDQHAAHERILYERVKKNFFSDTQKESQMLLLPDIINLTNKEMGIAKDNLSLFEKAGFVVEEFGDNTLKVSGVPEVCIDLDTKELFMETLDEINTVARTAKQEKEERFIATVACKAAVKANMALTEEEVTSLMNELLKLPNPFSCPHGRPTVIKMSKYDIERKFARK